MLQLTTTTTLYLYTYYNGGHCIEAVNRHNGKLACSRSSELINRLSRRKQGRKPEASYQVEEEVQLTRSPK